MSLDRTGTRQSVKIANGGTDSETIDVADTITWGIEIPALFTGTTISFKVASASDGTFNLLKDGYGGAVSRTVAAGDRLTLPNELTPWPYVRIVSGSAESAERTLVIVKKR